MQAYIDYMILRLSLDYYRCTKGDITNISLIDIFSHFNKDNDFGILKVNLFPFIITVANGQKEYLLNCVFKKFDKYEVGFLDEHVLNWTKDGSYSSQLISIKEYQSIIKIEHNNNSIRGNTNELNNLIKSIYTQNNYTDAFDKIDKSLIHIFNHNTSNLASYNVYDLMSWHKANNLWSSIIQNNDVNHNEIHQKIYGDIGVRFQEPEIAG